ncbi:hypothetical protein [Streptomyces sp. WZ-12]|uniref:hypothetical protein n=1 Tax=Streptomyces sp. WZ-12 TaxID=3030210 RepID=UPI002381838F|nr:hypothetical protein [Streptomyces sp. WZ-12]
MIVSDRVQVMIAGGGPFARTLGAPVRTTPLSVAVATAFMSAAMRPAGGDAGGRWSRAGAARAAAVLASAFARRTAGADSGGMRTPEA